MNGGTRALGEFFSPPQSSRWNKPGKQEAFLSRLCVTSVMSFWLLDLFLHPMIQEWLFRQRSQCAFRKTTSNAQIIKTKKSSCAVCQRSNQSTPWFPSGLLICFFFPLKKENSFAHMSNAAPLLDTGRPDVLQLWHFALMAWNSFLVSFIFESLCQLYSSCCSTSLSCYLYYCVISCCTVPCWYTRGFLFWKGGLTCPEIHTMRNFQK